VRFKLLVIPVTTCILSLSFACDRDDSIRVYQAPKDSQASASEPEEPQPPQVQLQAQPSTAPGSGQPGEMTVDGARMTVPAAWEKQPDKAMRIATFRAGEAEVIVSRFGAESFAQLLPNVNRWRGQVGLEPINDERDAQSEDVTVGGAKGKLFDMIGPKGRLRVAAVTVGEAVWFFKIQGPKDSVAGQQKTFDEFLRSIRFAQ